MVANPHRGEVALDCLAEGWVLRPDHTALMAIEERLGRSSMALARQAFAGDLGYRETVTIIDCCLVRDGAKITADEIGRKVYAVGVGDQALIEAIYAVWAMALRGPEERSGNGEAPTGETAAAPTPSESATASPAAT